jgi:hypothetical protein
VSFVPVKKYGQLSNVPLEISKGLTRNKVSNTVENGHDHVLGHGNDVGSGYFSDCDLAFVGCVQILK